MTFKWDVCANMASNLFSGEEEEEINSSLGAMRKDEEGLTSSELRAEGITVDSVQIWHECYL